MGLTKSGQVWVVWVRYGSGMGQVWVRCGSGMGQVWVRYGSGMGIPYGWIIHRERSTVDLN